MDVQSLGFRTDLIFHHFEGEVTDKGDHLLIRTPRNPTYRWGNYLYFGAPPRKGDFTRWRRLFAEEVGTPPQIPHQVFSWDSLSGEAGCIQPFLDVGFESDTSLVLAAESVHLPPRVNRDIEMRALTSDADFAEMLELDVLTARVDDGEEDEAGMRLFQERKMAAYRRMIAAGSGHWFGAFLEGKLVADMGLFWEGRLARYQSVTTHPDYRRRGICGTLLHFVGVCGLARPDVEKLVIAADANYFAKDSYRSVGFEVVEKSAGVELKQV
jgi:ribosomal protein S18 acetylase RimI-like enzyme